MLYPRKTEDGKLVGDDQMVGIREHLSNEHRMIFMVGEMPWETQSCDLLVALDSVSQDPLKMLIASPGGALDSAFLLYDTMRLMKCPIYTLGRYCASAAVIPLAAGTKRYLLPHAKVMIHLPSGQIMGDTTTIDIQHKQINKYKDEMVEVLRECGAKKSRRQILADMDREYWMDAKEAIDYGLADEIMTPEVMKDWLKEVTK